MRVNHRKIYYLILLVIVVACVILLAISINNKNKLKPGVYLYGNFKSIKYNKFYTYTLKIVEPKTYSNVNIFFNNTWTGESSHVHLTTLQANHVWQDDFKTFFEPTLNFDQPPLNVQVWYASKESNGLVNNEIINSKYSVTLEPKQSLSPGEKEIPVQNNNL